MSSTESSGAPAEATATTPPASSAVSSFGSTRGSGLARGKRPTTGPVAAASSAATEYTPTAIEVVSAPREYQNPFAPVETPVSATATQPTSSAQASAPAHLDRVEEVAPVKDSPAPAAEDSAPVSPVAADISASAEQAELNILPPEQQKVAPAQTWESEGFRPAREPRNDRPRREEVRRDEPRREEPRREERAPIDPSTIPAKFLYVRPGYNYVPTPSNYGGAPRDRESGPAAPPFRSAAPAEAPQKLGGFFGWLKSLFGGAKPAPVQAEARSGEQPSGDRYRGGGRGLGGGDSRRRRSRGGRNRNRGEYRSGGDQGGSSAT